MSVFGGQSQTEIATGLQNPDYSLTTNWGPNATPPDKQIYTDTWLTGTTGVDCKLVHGDRFQVIEGQMIQRVDQAKTSTYNGDFTDTYNGNVTKGMNEHVQENYCHTAGCDRDYMGHVGEHYHAGHTQQNDVEEIETRKWKAEVIQHYSTEQNPCKLELLGVAASYTIVLEASGASLGFCLRGAELRVAGGALELGVGKKEVFAFGDEIKALKNNIRGLQTGVRLLGLNTCPAEVYDGFLLAVNQKI